MAELKDVMVDLETMDSAATSAITAIGAVLFDPVTGEMGSEFYVKVNLQSSISAGLTVSGDTINWWLAQSEEARMEMAKQGTPLAVALECFTSWLNNTTILSAVRIWGNGASFDNAILANAYKAISREQPWKFWNDRCYRTVKSLYPDVPLVREGVHHNALADAKTQALHLCDIYKEMLHGKVQQS